MRGLNPIELTPLFGSDEGNTTINAGGTASVTSDPINLGKFCNLGYVALTFLFDASSHADARVTFEFWVSWDGETYVRSTDGYLIASDQHEASGTDSDGKDVITFFPPIAPYIKIKATETATQDAVFKAWLLTQ